MRFKTRLFYDISAAALGLFLILSAFGGLNAESQPFLFETMALFVFLPLAAALWLDYRRRVVRPIWLFLLAAMISLFCAVHFVLLVRLLA